MGDPSGIVVQTGDVLCVESVDYDIGGDCNAASTSGNCPGPDFNMQFLLDLNMAAEPFDLEDSSHDATLMIRATGASGGMPGACSDITPAADGELCSIGAGDTCCSGNCVVGPMGAGSCP